MWMCGHVGGGTPAAHLGPRQFSVVVLVLVQEADLISVLRWLGAIKPPLRKDPKVTKEGCF